MGPKLTGLLKPYASLILAIVVLTIAANSLNLLVPKLISRAIDTFGSRQLVLGTLVIQFLAVAVGIFFFTYLQNIAQIVRVRARGAGIFGRSSSRSSRRRISPTSSR